MALLSLGLFAMGTGSIRPCLPAFGGDQFKMPEQTKQMATFFSLFYFAIYSGSLISSFVSPILRNDFKCFDDDDCFSLSFGVAVALLVLLACKLLFFC